jgi:hypothetical protein
VGREGGLIPKRPYVRLPLGGGVIPPLKSIYQDGSGRTGSRVRGAREVGGDALELTLYGTKVIPNAYSYAPCYHGVPVMTAFGRVGESSSVVRVAAL